MDEKDDNLKKNNPKEEDNTIILDERGSKNNNDADVETSNKETEYVSAFDDAPSKNIAINVSKDLKKSAYTRVSNGIGSKTDKATESVIVLDETESKNTIIAIDDKDPTQTESAIDLDKADSESTIILDDDEVSKFSKRYPAPSMVIEVDKDTDCSIVEASSSIKERNTLYDVIFKENSLLVELIEKCLNMENANGMKRVINRTLLAIYKNVDDKYKKSDAFRKVLTRTIMQLDLEPERKFLHVKNLCDDLKEHKTKKRVNLTTLEGLSRNEQLINNIPTKRQRVDAIIDLDDDNQTNVAQGKDTVQNNTNQSRPKEYPPIEIDDDSSSNDLSADDGGNNCDIILLDENDNANKENNTKARRKKSKTRKNAKKIRDQLKKIIPTKIVRNPFHIARRKSITNHIENLNMVQDINSIQSISDPGPLLEPRNTLEPESLLEPRHTLEPESLLEPRHTDPRSLLEPRHASNARSLLESREVSNTAAIEFNKELIKDIESRIAVLKKEVEHLEEMEVETDSCTSPYIRCEQVKATIVNLYKELCQITGTEVTKRHEVRLQVVPGHPEGPVRCLEEFLNSNIDADGNTPFPDMHDVIQCVYEANVRFNMNWGRTQIMNEAQALFTQFGRTMQKRRQRREWKDLMSLVKHEAPDPAELDPALEARLLENTRLARRKEDELLSRFAEMEQGLVDPTDPELRLSIDQSGDSEESDVETPETGDGIRTADPSAPTSMGDIINSTVKGLLGTVGSIVTVSSGNIVIQPTIKFGNGSIYHSIPNEIQQKSIASNSEISLYSKEFQSFLCITQETPITHETAHTEFDNITNSCGQIEIISLNNLAKENAKVVHNIPSTQINENYLANITNSKANVVQNTPTQINENDLANVTKANKNSNEVKNTLTKIDETDLANVTKAKENAKMVQNTPIQINEHDLANITNLAKNILSLVQTDPCPKINSIRNEKNLLVAKTNECNTNSVANSALNTNDGNLQCKQNDKTHENGSHIFTQSTKPKRKNDSGITGSLDTPWEKIKDKTYQIEFEETNNSVSEESKDREKFQTDIESDVGNKEGIVKLEPLDIPSMLEELGQSFTATIFDIEDPFLVIEISDSSESEDEENM